MIIKRKLSLVLIHQSRKYRVGQASFGDDGDGHSCAYTELALLHPKIVEQCDYNVMRADGPRYISEGVYGGPSDGFLVGFQEVQEIKADSIPFFRRY